MADDSSGHEASTRRDYIKYGGAVIGGGLLAGCAGQSGADSMPKSTSTDTETTEATQSETDTDDGSYSVTMSPVGTVEFDAPPSSAVCFDDTWLDHLVALGQADALEGIARPDSPYIGFYEELPGVSVDTSDLTAIFGDDSIDKEVLYEIDPDVFHIDPIQATRGGGLDATDIRELSDNVAPFLANRFSLYNQFDGDAEYEFYTLWELSAKLATAYQVSDRSTALKAVYDEMVETIDDGLPPESERPSVALTGYYQGTFYSQPPLNSEGYGRAQYRPAKATDAYDGYPEHQRFGGQHGMELMLEIDPDVIVQANSLPPSGLLDPVKNGEVEGSQGLTAVQNDRIYYGPLAFQGPVLALFQTEMFVKQIYPEQFGEWPGVDESIPEDEQLFDRQQVADIINGEL